MKRILNTLLLVLVLSVVVGLFVIWLRPDPLRVEVASASRSPMRVSVDGEGKTRVRDRYTVAAPIAGRLRRIRLREGEQVGQRHVIAEIEPLPLAPLDPRQRAEAVARVNAAEDAKSEVDRLVERSRSVYEQSRRDFARKEVLGRQGVISQQEVEDAETTVATNLREYESLVSRSERATHDVEVAKSALVASDRSVSAAIVKVRAPTSGRVLQVFEESERVVSAGSPLIEISNPSRLEIVIELLSTEAVKVSPGNAALIDNWGGSDVLVGRVRLVEPSAFTKVSALGIEEQRVNVVIDLLNEESRLGDGFRVEGRIVIWEQNNVLSVPISTLFRRGEDWSLFYVENGVAYVKNVEIGHVNSSRAEVIGGLNEGTVVITHPSNDISDGTRIEITGRTK